VAALAAALIAAWLIAQPRTPDLAAATYRAQLFREAGFALWDARWYGGHDIPGYSLLFGPLSWLIGLRALAAVAALASALLFERIVTSVYGPRARWAAAWFAVAAVGDIWIGRVSFALGVPFALAAVLALLRRHPWLAGLAAVLSAAASPVAGVLLALAAAGHALGERSSRALAPLVLAPAALVLAVVLLFPEGGFEPFPLLSFLATAAVAVAFLLALPRGHRALRSGGGLYLLACVACLAVHTPVGSNVARFGVLLAGPMLLCAALGERARLTAARLLAVAAALCLTGVWVLWGPVRETAAVAGSADTSAAYYAPVVRFFAVLGGPVRVEVPLTRSHWEAALLAPHVSLARGWEKQLEERYDGAVLTTPRPGAYDAWLRAQAVGYVALPDARLDGSSAGEGRLIRAGLPYLRPVFASAHWRVYRVVGAVPLLTGPGVLEALGHDSFSLHARSAGSFLVRVHYSRYLGVGRGTACVGEAPGGWTSVRVRDAGEIVVRAGFTLTRAFAAGGACHTSG
jgi:hypothetical protein